MPAGQGTRTTTGPIRGRITLGVLGALLAALLGGCQLLERPPEIVDGLSVGSLADCGACEGPPWATCQGCESIASIARRELEADWPDHPAVVAWTFHGEGYYPGPSGEKILSTRSGTMVIAVVTFADGTRHALPVYCGVGGCREGR